MWWKGVLREGSVYRIHVHYNPDFQYICIGDKNYYYYYLWRKSEFPTMGGGGGWRREESYCNVQCEWRRLFLSLKARTLIRPTKGSNLRVRCDKVYTQVVVRVLH